ncbi:MAG: cytochrome P450 [Candidatus Limnocylindrales bacterium]|nr:cytochrome P450 [Candidatus Limnocylindrales bacterium]
MTVPVTPAGLGYTPADPAFIADPYPAFARLRADHPVIYDPATNQWLVARFADVLALLRDRRLGRSYVHVATHEEFGRTPPPAWQAPFEASQRLQLIDMEPPDHTRLRRLVSTAFTPRTVEGLRPRVTELVDGLVSAALERGAFDLLADLIEQLPVAVIAELLGIPPADRGQLRPWSADMTLMFELTRGEADERRAVQATVEFSDYLRTLVRDRRARPRADLLSELALVAEAGDRLSEDELIATAILLLNAGHEASVNGAANAWWTLFRHPQALAALRADPGLVPTAVEELLRFDTPAPMFERWVLEDIELHGITIPRGEELALLFASANRDPAQFANPDGLVLDRAPNPHLSFGAGIHFCLGAPLARLELGVLFRAILEQMPTLELVSEPAWKPRFVLRGLQALPVRVA